MSWLPRADPGAAGSADHLLQRIQVHLRTQRVALGLHLAQPQQRAHQGIEVGQLDFGRQQRLLQAAGGGDARLHLLLIHQLQLVEPQAGGAGVRRGRGRVAAHLAFEGLAQRGGVVAAQLRGGLQQGADGARHGVALGQVAGGLDLAQQRLARARHQLVDQIGPAPRRLLQQRRQRRVVGSGRGVARGHGGTS